MTFWQWLYRSGPGWPTERGWYAVALFVQTGVILWMVASLPELRNDEFFKALANAVVITGWIGFAVGMKDNARERENVSKALDVAHETAKSVPNSDSSAIHEGDTVTMERNP